MSRFHSPYYGLFHTLARQQEPEALRMTLLGCLSVIAPGGGYAILGYNAKQELTVVGDAPRNSPLIPPCLATANYFLQHADVGDYSASDDRLYVAVKGANGHPEAVVVSASVSAESYEAIQALCVHYNCILHLLNSSVTDSLTGLYNRKAFDQIMMRTHARIERDDTAVHAFIVMVDIDHFKAVNDDFGHLFGDEVLLRVSQVITQSVRDNDKVFRYGGEEFSVLLVDLNHTEAMTACERIRRSVDESDFAQVPHVSVSLGVAEFSAHSSVHTCVEHADKALYYSKENGRNQINSYWSLYEQGIIKGQFNEGDVELF